MLEEWEHIKQISLLKPPFSYGAALTDLSAENQWKYIDPVITELQSESLITQCPMLQLASDEWDLKIYSVLINVCHFVWSCYNSPV